MMNDLEWRLRHLEELSLLLRQQAAAMKPAIGKLMQDEEMFMQGPIETGPPPPNTTITGTIRGCASIALASAAVEVLDGGGTSLWTGTTDGSGNYGASVFLAANATLTIRANINASDARASRFTLTSTTSAITAGATNSGRNVTIGPASGYKCSSYFYFPLTTTLHLTDSKIGSCTLTHDGTNWVGTVTYNYPSCSPLDGSYFCGAVSGLVVTFTFNGTVCSASCKRTVSGNCPSTTGSTVAGDSHSLTVTSSSPVVLSQGSLAGAQLYCNTTFTRTISE